MSYVFWSFVFLSVALAKGKTIFVTVPPAYATELVAASLDCIKKTGAQPDILQQLLDWKFQENDQVKKFIYCFGTTSGFADTKGHFKTDMMVKLVGNNKRKNQYANVINECNKSVGKDKYETFYETVVCFHDKTPILFKL